jgi:hypothetical protein
MAALAVIVTICAVGEAPGKDPTGGGTAKIDMGPVWVNKGIGKERNATVSVSWAVNKGYDPKDIEVQVISVKKEDGKWVETGLPTGVVKGDPKMGPTGTWNDIKINYASSGPKMVRVTLITTKGGTTYKDIIYSPVFLIGAKDGEIQQIDPPPPKAPAPPSPAPVTTPVPVPSPM